MKMADILTDRLRLTPLTLKQLRACLAAPQRLEQELGFPVSLAVFTEPVIKALGIKISKMAAAPASDHAWYTYWLFAIRAKQVGVGLAGFKGAPDLMGQVEIGYGIDPAWEGQGYTTEAAKALVAWALGKNGCMGVIAETNRENSASQRILVKIGFKAYAESDTSLWWRIERKQPGKMIPEV
jgi:[ribosomal protein S5]-alanine N-acetyltransferase